MHIVRGHLARKRDTYTKHQTNKNSPDIMCLHDCGNSRTCYHYSTSQKIRMDAHNTANYWHCAHKHKYLEYIYVHVYVYNVCACACTSLPPPPLTHAPEIMVKKSTHKHVHVHTHVHHANSEQHNSPKVVIFKEK